MTVLDKRFNAFPARNVELEFGRLGYRDSGTGVPLVFLHGIGSGAASWVLQFEEFAKDFRCLAWDAPGYGESTALQLDAPTESDYVAIFRAWLQAIGVDDYHLVAHSLGALTAGTHCQPNINLPRTLTFIGPTLGYGACPELERIEMVNRRMQLFDALGAKNLAKKRAPALLSETASAEALEIVRWNMSRLRRNGYRHAAQILANTDLLARVGDIGIPVTVMCGTADEVTPVALSQELAAAYRHASYVPLDGCGHAAYVEGAMLVNRLLRKQFESSVETTRPSQSGCGARN